MNVRQRAVQIWPVLVLAARNRQTLTYEMLGQLVSLPAPGLGQCLDPIQSYCVENALPPLTALVVGKDSGMPGTGFTAAGDVPAAQARVFAYDWSGARCPSEEEFGHAD